MKTILARLAIMHGAILANINFSPGCIFNASFIEPDSPSLKACIALACTINHGAVVDKH